MPNRRRMVGRNERGRFASTLEQIHEVEEGSFVVESFNTTNAYDPVDSMMADCVDCSGIDDY